MTSLSLADLVDVKAIITGVLGAAGGYIWHLDRSVQKLKRYAASTQTQLPAVLAAIEKLREDLTQWRIAAAVQQEQLIRARKDIDAAHAMLRDLRCPDHDDDDQAPAA